ncbi:MarR family winged helix-turn-helix transcriptional regulator [Chloroflexota bacterium]
MKSDNGDAYGDFELWSLLHQTCHIMEKNREMEIREIGITMMQAALLWAVKELGPAANVTNVSRRLLRKPHTVSSMLDRMEKQGFVIKTKDEKLASMVRISVTEKGDEIRRRSRKEMKVIREILSLLSQEERYVMKNALLKMRSVASEKAVMMREIPPA